MGIWRGKDLEKGKRINRRKFEDSNTIKILLLG